MRQRRAPGRIVVLMTIGLLCGGCAHYPETPALEPPFDPNGGYRFTALPADPAADETFVLLTLSGGGTRAAAFSYGVLLGLRDTELGPGRRMLDELDVVSSVSGGSFAAAYLGAFGADAFFSEFPDAVLHRSIETDLAWRTANPLNWFRLVSRRFSRSDLAEEYYDEEIYAGKRYADLPRERPFIVLNATDVSSGSQFSFTQEHFDRVCGDLDGVALSRGVTASSAFPVVFAPLTLDNRPKERCDYARPIWVKHARKDFELAPARWNLGRSWREYEDAKRRPYIHLSDGGIADNIGLRVLTNGVQGSGPFQLEAKVNRGEIRRLVVVVVDAMPRDAPEADRSPRPPGLVDVLNAAATKPMENYSGETVERVRDWFDEWDRAARDFSTIRARCDAYGTEPERARCRERMGVVDENRPPHPELLLLHVRFEAIPDKQARKRLLGVPTRLQLPREQVEELVDWGRRLLVESEAYELLVSELRATSQP